MYLYIKALHIIFIVTWFSGMFYIVRLFIYNAEAETKPEPERSILQAQFKIMMRRLWYGITWPSAIITLILGPWLASQYGSFPEWLAVKLLFVMGLYIYHFSLHIIFKQQMGGIFKWNSRRLRIWNELATIFLVAIVLLAVMKESLSFVWGLLGLAGLMIMLFAGIGIYRRLRK